MMDQADAGGRGKGEKAPQSAGRKEPGNLAPGGRAALDARLEKARELSWQYQGSVKEGNAVSAYAAAEQLWTLWDQELNLVYGSIRARMSGKEAEALRIAELEWMKERDQTAARAAEDSPVPRTRLWSPERPWQRKRGSGAMS